MSTMFRSKIVLFVYKVAALFSVLFLSIRIVISTPLGKYDDPLVRERFAQFNCYKRKTCTPGPPKVCGYNPATLGITEFEDMCMLYEVNCKEKEFYRQVNMTKCLDRAAFLAAHNVSAHSPPVNRTYELRFVHTFNVTTPTTESTTLWRLVPRLVQHVINKVFR